MDKMMSEKDDTRYWADVAADELGKAMALMGVGFLGTRGDEDGDVSVAFPGLQDAEALMVLAVGQDETPGSLYDRSTASCVTLSDFVKDGGEPTDEQVADAIARGWVWTIHPAMTGRRMDWHVSVDIPAADANQLTANLNALRLGGAL